MKVVDNSESSALLKNASSIIILSLVSDRFYVFLNGCHEIFSEVIVHYLFQENSLLLRHIITTKTLKMDFRIQNLTSYLYIASFINHSTGTLARGSDGRW